MLNTELLVDESDRLSWTEISFLPAQVTQDFELKKKKSQILGPKAVKKKNPNWRIFYSKNLASIQITFPVMD